MASKVMPLDLTSKEPLIERQRKLWTVSDQIQMAQQQNQPLPKWLEKWLVLALRKIALGQDANEVLNVKPEKQGVRKDSLKRELDKKMVMGAIASRTNHENENKKKTKVAIDEVTKALPVMKRSTARKTWSSSLTDRKPTFTLSKK
jgi:hypothetical protein